MSRPTELAGYAASHHKVSRVSLHEMRQQRFGQRDRSQNIEIHQSLVHGQFGLFDQRDLTSTAVVHKNVHLNETRILKNAGDGCITKYMYVYV